ncbi:MAG: alpha/beta fold hydrolase [Bacteroidales bacterium]|nr:alpha/beta fold hydrolase [Bacteroidales bacterium]
MLKRKIEASSDGLQLAMLISEPAGEPKGIVQIVHGMCEHKERYVPFMEYLSSHGYICAVHDHRGHGETVRSEEDLGYMYKGGWRALVEDIKLVQNDVKASYPSLPYTLFGHSMGSMAVRSFTKRYDDSIDTLFVCGCPSYNPAGGAGRFLASVIGMFKGEHYRSPLLQKLSFGSFNKPFEDEGYPSAWVCSDKDTLEAYHKDPYCTFTFTVNGFKNLLDLMQDCYSTKGWKMANQGLPVHFISGADDPCRISDKAIGKAADLMRQLGYKNTDLHLYPGMRHEILNETDRIQVWNDVLSKLA